MKANRNAKLPITCPNCSHKFEKTLGWLESNDNFACPTDCGNTFDTNQLIGKIDKSLQGLENSLRDTIRGINKKLKF